MRTTWQAVVASLVLLAATGTANAEAGWQRVAAAPAGLEYSLTDVTAVAPDLAYAAGVTETGGGLFLSRWNGVEWSLVEGLPATSNPGLWGVDARGPGRVLAVGEDQGVPLLLGWNGSAWYRAAGTEQGRFLDVAAVSDTTAWAVGREGAGLTYRPVAHRWNGRVLERFALPAPGSYARANAVSGRSAGDVWAVGADGGLAGMSSRGLSWRWTGSGWHAVGVPQFGAHQVELTDVVTTPAAVWAVGRADGQPLVLTWSGGSWQRIPLGWADTKLNAVADDGRGGLRVAGETRTGPDATAFLARYDGSSWTVDAVPSLAFSAMRGITRVPGTTAMWATGRYFQTGTYCSGCRATIATTG